MHPSSLAGGPFPVVDLARAICEELTELGHEVAIDNEIRGGQDWWDQLCG